MALSTPERVGFRMESGKMAVILFSYVPMVHPQVLGDASQTITTQKALVKLNETQNETEKGMNMRRDFQERRTTGISGVIICE